MTKKFDERVLPAINQLRAALSAVERAKKDDYPPHIAACLSAALDHAARAQVHIQRAS